MCQRNAATSIGVLFPKFALCSDGLNWLRAKEQWLDGTQMPSSGMIIFFDWADDGQDGKMRIMWVS